MAAALLGALLIWIFGAALGQLVGALVIIYALVQLTNDGTRHSHLAILRRGRRTLDRRALGSGDRKSVV